MMTYRLTFGMALILSIVFFTYSWTTMSKKELPHTALRANTPDAWMESVDATFIGQDGHLLMKVHAPTAKHYADKDTTFLTTPEFLLYRNSANPWRILAGKATAMHGIRQIRLSESVTLHHPGDNTQPATWVSTDKVTIHPNERTAETSEMVTLRQPHLSVRGRGLQADLNTGDIKLLAETRGEYALND